MSYMELFYGDQPKWTNKNKSTYYTTYTANRPMGWKTTSLVFQVPLCCESCVQKIRKALSKDEGIEAVDVDMQKSKVIVTGYLNPQRVLGKIRKVKKNASFWDSSYDDGTQNPYSHTADFDYTDPHAFDRSLSRSSAYDYNYSSSYRLPSPAEYSSRNSYYRGSGPGLNSHHHHGGSYRSSYDAYRYL